MSSTRVLRVAWRDQLPPSPDHSPDENFDRIGVLLGIDRYQDMPRAEIGQRAEIMPSSSTQNAS